MLIFKKQILIVKNHSPGPLGIAMHIKKKTPLWEEKGHG